MIPPSLPPPQAFIVFTKQNVRREEIQINVSPMLLVSDPFILNMEGV